MSNRASSIAMPVSSAEQTLGGLLKILPERLIRNLHETVPQLAEPDFDDLWDMNSNCVHLAANNGFTFRVDLLYLDARLLKQENWN